MAKNLVLLRHSDAQFSFDTSDQARKLTAVGEKKLFLVGEWFSLNALEPQKILCSPAQRTRDTLQGFLEYFSAKTQIVFANNLYEASWQDLLQTVQQTAENVETLLVVCHEPAVSYFAKHLSNPAINPAEVAKLNLAYPPLTLSHLVLESSWEKLAKGAASLQKVITFQL